MLCQGASYLKAEPGAAGSPSSSEGRRLLLPGEPLAPPPPAEGVEGRACPALGGEHSGPQTGRPPATGPRLSVLLPPVWFGAGEPAL